MDEKATLLDEDSESTLRAQAACAAFHSKMKEYFDVGKYTDVNITCQDRVFKCHRLVLAAASKYFDAMFGGNFEESHAPGIVLHDIDPDVFELVLHYMYRGMAPVIDDDNVYSLLLAATILNLWDIDERCMRYLTEGNIPMNYAVEIYLFACVTGNKTLISCASQCILKHLPYVSKNDLFLRMSFEDLGTLLEFTVPDDSPKKEYVLLNTICRWISSQTCSQDEKESLFLRLTQNVCFQHIPVVFADACGDALLQPDLGITKCSDVENLNPSLYVYLDSMFSTQTISGAFSSPLATTLFSLEKSDDEWHSHHDIVPTIRFMKTVLYDNQLYSFQLNGANNEKFAFLASPSVNFSENVRSLARPPFTPSAHPHISACSQKNGIYACDGNSNGLFHYNCEQDEWFPISLSTKEEFFPAFITMCHNQLYIMGSGLNSSNMNILQTYDHRTGKLEAASKSSLRREKYFSQVCTHRERVYVSNCRFSIHHVEVFNPVANKWNELPQIFQRTCTNERCENVIPVVSRHRLASFENKLWMFITFGTRLHGSTSRIMTKCYDSFTERWDQDNDCLSNAAVHCKKQYTMLRKVITDVIVYKPRQ